MLSFGIHFHPFESSHEIMKSHPDQKFSIRTKLIGFKVIPSSVKKVKIVSQLLVQLQV